MILVTGASGALGGLVLDRLPAGGDPEVVAGTRAAASWTGRHPARLVDFDAPGTLEEAFRGVDVLLLVSAGYADDDVVFARHGAAIDAAVKAGVRHVVYTSLAGSAAHLTVALAHRWTERRLAESACDWTVLRNGLYAELPAGLAAGGAAEAAATGVFTVPLGEGAIPVVARADLAEAAARVVTDVQASLLRGERSPHTGRTYELDGTESFGGAELAAALAEALGTPVGYAPESFAKRRAALVEAGLPAYEVTHTMSLFATVTGRLITPGDSDLPALLGGAATPPGDVLLRALPAGGRASR